MDFGVIEAIEKADAEETAAGNPDEGTGTKAEAGATETETETPEAKGTETTDAEAPKTEKLVFEEEVEIPEDLTPEKSDDTEAPEMTDDMRVKDPVSGEVTTWGKIKGRQEEANRDYHRKMQDLADERRALREEGRTEEEIGEETEEVEDPLAELDPDDPVVAALKQTQAALGMLQEENQHLKRSVEQDQAVRNRENLERTDKELMTKFPVLTENDLVAAGEQYLGNIHLGKEIKYEAVVEAYANRMMEVQSGSVTAWKEKHKRPVRPEVSGAGAVPEVKPITGKDFMKNGLADIIAKEDAELARQGS